MIVEQAGHNAAADHQSAMRQYQRSAFLSRTNVTISWVLPVMRFMSSSGLAFGQRLDKIGQCRLQGREARADREGRYGRYRL